MKSSHSPKNTGHTVIASASSHNATEDGHEESIYSSDPSTLPPDYDSTASAAYPSSRHGEQPFSNHL